MNKRRLLISIYICVTVMVYAEEKQYYKAVLGGSTDCIELHPESEIFDGDVESAEILLRSLEPGEDGYFKFWFDQLQNTDHLLLSLASENESTIYGMEFAGGKTTLKISNQSDFDLGEIPWERMIYKIERCGDVVTFYKSETQILHSLVTSGGRLLAKLEVYNANQAIVSAEFENNTNSCKDCPDMVGQSLFPGDLMFIGYDNQLGTEMDRISITNIVDLTPGTSFSITNAIMKTASSAPMEELWYRNSQSADERLMSQKITYRGIASIPAGAVICFDLPITGSGGSELANNFSIDGVTSDDFCVQNDGKVSISIVNLRVGLPGALFLFQGAWAQGTNTLSGRVLSGLQYGGPWVAPGQTSNQYLFSEVPTDIQCFPINDAGSVSARYAYYGGQTGDNLAIIPTIADFSNWTVNTGDLPLAACGSRSIQTLSLLDEKPNTHQPSSRSFPVQFVDNTTFQYLSGEVGIGNVAHQADRPTTLNWERTPSSPPSVDALRGFYAEVFPNPFEQSFNLKLQLPETEKIYLTLLNATGQAVSGTTNGVLTTGLHTISVKPQAGLPSGVYFLRIVTPNRMLSKRVMKVVDWEN